MASSACRSIQQSPRDQFPLQRRRIRELPCLPPATLGRRDIGRIVIDEEQFPRRMAEAAFRKAEDRRIGLGQLFHPRHHDIAEMIEDRMKRAEFPPEAVGEIGEGE